MNEFTIIQTLIILGGFIITMIAFVSRFATKNDIKTLEGNLTRYFDNKLDLVRDITDAKITDLDYRVRRLEDKINGFIVKTNQTQQALYDSEK